MGMRGMFQTPGRMVGYDGRIKGGGSKKRKKEGADFREGGRGEGTFVLYTRVRQATQKREKQEWKEISSSRMALSSAIEDMKYFSMLTTVFVQTS